jgi:hypothetical protein
MKFRKALLLIIIAELLIAILAINNYGFNIEGLQATTRFSGRLSLAVFSLMFILLTLNRAILSSLLSFKPFHIFAIAHGIHLVQLLSCVYLSKANLIPIRLAGGFLAYVFIFIMPVIQHYFEARKIELKKFTLAENIYLYYVWFIFFMSYLPRIQGKLPNVGGSYGEFVVLMIWVCILMIARGILLITTNRGTPAKTS